MTIQRESENEKETAEAKNKEIRKSRIRVSYRVGSPSPNGPRSQTKKKKTIKTDGSHLLFTASIDSFRSFSAML